MGDKIMRNSYVRKQELKKKIVRIVCLILAIAMASSTIAITLYYLLN